MPSKIYYVSTVRKNFGEKTNLSKENSRNRKEAWHNSKTNSDQDNKNDCGSLWRQLGVIVLINMVTFLQGASLATPSISLVTLTQVLNANKSATGSFLPDIFISPVQETFISK